ncbi:hypothetical protein PI125_g3232 [Phytophthora idaei]|nr:hypothetical protein PI125_g3232 [Phytophthora idaei]KAG3167626.1 hypothetical protein PI126_g3755 [Phytophthora idaei]
MKTRNPLLFSAIPFIYLLLLFECVIKVTNAVVTLQFAALRPVYHPRFCSELKCRLLQWSSAALNVEASVREEQVLGHGYKRRRHVSLVQASPTAADCAISYLFHSGLIGGSAGLSSTSQCCSSSSWIAALACQLSSKCTGLTRTTRWVFVELGALGLGMLEDWICATYLVAVLWLNAFILSQTLEASSDSMTPQTFIT